MGYLVQALREKFKDSKIITLHIDENLPPMPNGEPTHYFKDEAGVQDFLEATVPQTGAAGIKIIEWRPSLDCYRTQYARLLSQVVEFIKRLDAGEKTVSVFGRRWFKNFFKNIGIVQKTLLYKTMNIPVIITGSGPGLEKDLPLIREAQNNCLIIAASSSLMALNAGGVIADLVIATDGGPWALRHIYTFFRNSTADKNTNIGFAANLCAAIPSQCEREPFLIINDGSFWQSAVFHKLALPSVIVPQRGTVAASAVELALLLSGENIYLAGTDFSVKDIKTHARPYAFDILLFDKDSRFSPVYAQSFVRSGLLEKGGSFNIYSSWFKKQLLTWPKRVFFLESGHKEAICKKATFKRTGAYFKTNTVNGACGSLRKRSAQALIESLNDSRFGEKIKNELAPLLCPGEKEADYGRIKAEISQILADTQ